MFIFPSQSQLSSTTLTRNEADLRPFHWAHIWDSFAAELTTLVALHVDERDSDRSEGVANFRYVRSWSTFSYSVFNSNENLNAIDAEALDRFHMVVAARAKEVCEGLREERQPSSPCGVTVAPQVVR